MFIKRNLLVCLLLISLGFPVWAQTLNPGSDRWTIKTSLPANVARKTVPLKTLLSLKNPVAKQAKRYDKERIPLEVNGFKEGDIITTYGWVQLIALEDDKNHHDGDYRLQLTTSNKWSDSCLILEIPFPQFIKDAALKDSCAKARQYVKARLLKNQEPSDRGIVLTPAVYVRVTGQLFFDAVHIKGSLRGKTPKGFSPMHSYTPWELHPVIAIELAPKSR